MTLVVSDVIRNQLINDGVNLGLLSSAFSLPGLNLLWSPDLLSTFSAIYRLRVKVALCCTIIICCILISVVGPSSALLFLPSQLWVWDGGTDFYIAGTNDQLWPQRLTINHTGPSSCRQFPLPNLEFCPFASSKSMLHNIQRLPDTPGWNVYRRNGGPPRLIIGRSPDTEGVADPQVSEMWAWTVHGATTTHLQDLVNKYNIAHKHSTGRNRRRRDFVDGGYTIQDGLIPVVRTACGPLKEIGVNTTTLPFPVLESARKWHEISHEKLPTWGPLKDVEVHGMRNLNIADDGLARAKWLSLPSDFEGVTAGLVHICQNKTSMFGRACAVDGRWANGQTFRLQDQVVIAWSASIGKLSVKTSGNSAGARPLPDFSDLVAHYGKTIKADQEWLDMVSPLYETTSKPDGFNMTVFEAMINTSYGILKIPPTTLTDEFRARLALEYTVLFLRIPLSLYLNLSHLVFQIANALSFVNGRYAMTLYFVDVMSRTGWSHQFKNDQDDWNISPALQEGWTESDRYLNGGPIFNRPAPSILPTVVSHVHSYKYGTAWILHDSGQYIAVAVLGIYLLIALIHTFIIAGQGRTIEAWDSINELVVLAWNSVPSAKENALKNCSAGIKLTSTLRTKVKVAVAADGETLELVPVDRVKLSKTVGETKNVVTEVAYG